MQALPLRYHVHTSTSDAVFRVEIDAYCIDNLVMKGLFPLASSVLTLVVMFVILLRLDVTVALLSLAVVPFHYAALRYYINNLSDTAEVRAATRVEGLPAAVRVVLGHQAREELRAGSVRTGPVQQGGRHRHGGPQRRSPGRSRCSTWWWPASRSSAPALVVTVGALAVLDGRLTAGALLVIVAYLQSVYGPLSAIAHTTGSLQQSIASARRVRAVLDLAPERSRPSRRPRRLGHRRPHPVRRRGLRLRPVAARAGGRQLRGAPRRADRGRRPDRCRQDQPRQPDSPLLRTDRRPRAHRRPRRPRLRDGAACASAIALVLQESSLFSGSDRGQHPLRPARRH